MSFKPGYKRRKRTYSFRAYVDANGWNKDRDPRGALKLWDLNRRKDHANIVRVTRGRGHLVILLGKRYRRIALMDSRRRG